MSESLSRWLALREPVDHASRSVDLTRAVAAVLPADRPLRIIDLGSGTGSNVRYLAPILPSPQKWLLVDQDASLMDESAYPNLDVETRVMNLGDFDERVVAGAHLVTASALLDLVSDRWLQELAGALRSNRAAGLFALTYVGRSRCEPVDSFDDRVLELFNTHQRRNDKGFGLAAGPDAVENAALALASAGYRIRREPSNWILKPEMQPLQIELIHGWAEAAAEIAPADSAAIRRWRERRIAYVAGGRSTIVVSHEDVAATLVDLPL